MYKNITKLSFNNQLFFVGLDIHKKSWRVTIRSGRIVLKTFSMNPSSEELFKYMNKNYPGGKYFCVYEAGFSGFWIHRELTRYGFISMIVNPSEIPTTGKERFDKNDTRDSRKLARELELGNLVPIYVPSSIEQEIRSFSRLRIQLVRKQSRIKNQIKGYLHFYGHKIPENHELKHWSKRFIEQLKELKFEHNPGKAQLEIYVDELLEIRKRLVKVILSLKSYCKELNIEKNISILMSVPGVAFVTAVTIYTEIIDINRFSNFNQLAAYVGLIPSVRSSADKENVLGIRMQHNMFLRPLLIEAAWVAVRKDPALTLSYNDLITRMSKQEAIIRIAKKLLRRINYVLKNQQHYVCAVV